MGINQLELQHRQPYYNVSVRVTAATSIASHDIAQGVRAWRPISPLCCSRKLGPCQPPSLGCKWDGCQLAGKFESACCMHGSSCLVVLLRRVLVWASIFASLTRKRFAACPMRFYRGCIPTIRHRLWQPAEVHVHNS
jgi:hypothetical protein